MLRKVGYGLGIFWILAIVYLSLIPASPLPYNVWDKAQHFFAYGFLSLWFFVLARDFKICAYYALGFISLGIILEFLQILVPGREFSLIDIMANSLGVGVIWLLRKSIFKLADILD